MANEGSPANPSLSGAQILAKLLALGALGAAFTDSAFAITGSSDATKIARFEVDGLTTATTRVYTLPDANIVVSGSASALTSGRVPFATTGGLLTDSAALTWSGTSFATTATGAASFSTAGGYTSTVATGTAPFTATSTTACPNLNASLLLGNTWAAPGAIGGTTPGSAAHTTISASGQITSTVSTGTSPLVIASTTAVANLNASLLLGSTWSAPGSIGSGTPAAGAFTTLSASSTLAITGTSAFTGAAGFGGGGVSGFSPLAVQGFSGISGTAAIGIFVNAAAPSTATSAVRGAQFSLTGAASTTHAEATGFLCAGIAPGAGGTLTRVQAAWLNPQSASGTNTCGLLISSGLTYTGAWAIRSEATEASYFAGSLQVAGVLQIGNAYVATPPTCTGYVTIKDSTGTTYKVLVST